MLATIVDTDALLKTIASAAISAIAVALVFSFAILGAARFLEYGRANRPVAAVAFGILGVIALAAAAAGVTVGIIVMTQK